ncbi:MAG: M67 family metallopeptidase [Myxococcales bacterium]|nr:M67 family metallopeptidase [Myxococcales bacterium]
MPLGQLTIDPSALRRLHAHAEEGYPHEAVGCGVARAHALINERSDSPANRYKVSGLTLMRAQQQLEDEGLHILGYYHSHPDHQAQYSDFDRDHALPNLSYVIVSVQGGAVTDTLSWRLREDRSAMDPEPLASPEPSA